MGALGHLDSLLQLASLLARPMVDTLLPIHLLHQLGRELAEIEWRYIQLVYRITDLPLLPLWVALLLQLHGREA